MTIIKIHNSGSSCVQMGIMFRTLREVQDLISNHVLSVICFCRKKTSGIKPVYQVYFYYFIISLAHCLSWKVVLLKKWAGNVKEWMCTL